MVQELDAAPDWLTVTTDTYRDTEYLRRIAGLYIGTGPLSRPWKFMSYYGRRLHDPRGRGGCAFAEHSEGSHGVMQVWGSLTADVGRQLARHKYKATRVDLAVTVLHDKPQPSVMEMLQAIGDTTVSLCGIVPVSQEGGTLYVGSRKSDFFGRLYDKGSQLGDKVPARQLWRYEVEYKRKSAEAMAEQTFYTPQTSDVRRHQILSNVEHFFREHQVAVPFTSQVDDKHSLVRYATRVQDAERTLKWLSEQVRPALLRLVLDGRQAEVCEALGVNVLDGVPSFEAAELAVEPGEDLWQWLDKQAVLG